MAQPKRVFIVDDHPIVRRGLCQLFDAEPGFSVCGEASNVTQALLAILECSPDLVVCDLALEGRDGLELTRQLQVEKPNVPLLILSMHDEQLYASRALAAGARGYLMKRGAGLEIIKAAQAVLDGKIYVSAAVEQLLQQAGATDPDDTESDVLKRLSDREFEVFKLIGQGYPPRHIAGQLKLSVSTVEVYRQRLKQKLSLETSALLLRYAVRWCKDHDQS